MPISSSLEGRDALYAIVQMPPGIPVATVGIDGGMNAGILATSILALKDQNVEKRYEEYRASLAEKIVKVNAQLKEVKYKYKVN